VRHTNKIELHPSCGSHLDYVIDGRSLLVYLRSRGRKDTDFTSPFGRTTCEFESRVASWLLLREKPPFSTGRVPLLFCPTCADLGCGAVTVVIERIDDFFVWRDFGFEAPASESVDLTPYEHLRGFTFSQGDYTKTFSPFWRRAS
jgi:hypothetical protein